MVESVESDQQSSLTPRQWQVVLLRGQALTEAQVAEKLRLNRRTVSKHVELAYRRLGVHNLNSALGALRGEEVGELPVWPYASGRAIPLPCRFCPLRSPPEEGAQADLPPEQS